jgi:carbohydrate-selective porin OprB
MEGNYRLFGWTNTNDYVKLDGTGDGKEKNYGFGLSFDQQLSSIFGAFARYSWANGAIDNGIDSSNTWSLGLQATVKGLSEKDVVALAYGQVMPSDEYKDNVDGNAKSENHLEVYYSWNVTDYLAISPDFQMVENPFYNGDDDTAYVGSIRMQISF